MGEKLESFQFRLLALVISVKKRVLIVKAGFNRSRR